MLKTELCGNMKINLGISIFAFAFFFLHSCGETSDSKENQKTNITSDSTSKQAQTYTTLQPNFNSDTAYFFIEKQVAFGPRVPGSDAHKKCATFLANELKRFNWEVQIQEAKVTTFNKKILDIKNIIGSYNPTNQKRILLFAHWDTRPFADKDTKDQNKPILGANDGGSGVGVLLEIARQISITKPSIGIDIIFFDAEDYGQPENTMTNPAPDSWCLGTQYWAKNPHVPNYFAQFGILLDMVGAKDATFPLEGTSMHFAPAIIQNIWKTAHSLGHQKYFINKQTGMTTDDHLYVNSIIKIPSINIVHINPITEQYGHFHHTHTDNMDIIDKETLQAVGETVLATIFK